MRTRNWKWVTAAAFVFAAGTLVCSGSAFAQQQQQQQQTQTQQKPPDQQATPPTLQPGAGALPVAGAPAAPAVNKEEEDAYKALYDSRAGDPQKEAQLGEDFMKKFPASRYSPAVYSLLTTAYMNAGQEDKMFVAGDKAIELNPDNVDVLALMAMALPRRVNPQSLDAAQQFQKAALYAKHAIEIIPNLKKPDELDDVSFTKAKNDKLAMCHSGLGLVNLQTGKFPDAVTELTQAVQLSASPDAVDYYLLGMADEKTSHFADALTAFGKCSDGPMADACKKETENAKKLAASSPAAPPKQ